MKDISNEFANFVESHAVHFHYNDAIMGAVASQTISLMIFYSSVYSGADQRKHQSSASLAFVRRIHRWPVNSPHKWPITWKMFAFDDVIILTSNLTEKAPLTGMVGMVSSPRLRHTRDYLTPVLCSSTVSSAMEKSMSFPTKICTVSIPIHALNSTAIYLYHTSN